MKQADSVLILDREGYSQDERFGPFVTGAAPIGYFDLMRRRRDQVADARDYRMQFPVAITVAPGSE